MRDFNEKYSEISNFHNKSWKAENISLKINEDNWCPIGMHRTTFTLRQNSIKGDESITNQRIIHLDERTQCLCFGASVKILS